MSISPRLGLPFLDTGQTQKEFAHNEALQALDMLVAAAVEVPPLNTPPSSPPAGACYVVGSAPTGVWSGKADNLAGYSAGGWRFAAPVEGLQLLVKSTGLTGVYRAGSWEYGVTRTGSVAIGGQPVVGARQAAIPTPSGGSTIDSNARTAIAGILAAMRAHGLIDP